MRLSLIGAQITTRKSTYRGLDNEFVRGPKRRRLDILDSTKDTAIHACVRDHVTEKYALDESYKPPRCSDANFALGRLIIPLRGWEGQPLQRITVTKKKKRKLKDNRVRIYCPTIIFPKCVSHWNAFLLKGYITFLLFLIIVLSIYFVWEDILSEEVYKTYFTLFSHHL